MNVPRPFLPSDRLDERISPIAKLAWDGRAKFVKKKGGYEAGEQFLAVNRVPAEVVSYHRAAVAATSTIDSVFGNEQISIGAWADALRSESVFYRLLSDGALLQLPFNSKVSLKTSWPTAGLIAEGGATPVGRDIFNNVVLSPQKVGVQLVATDELMLRVDREGQRLFNSQLEGLCSERADAQFLALITAGLTPVTTAGVSAVNAHHDLRTMGLTVKKVGTAKNYFVCGEDVAWMASTLADSAGGRAFPEMTPSGGVMDGVPCLVATGCPAGELVLLDANQIAANGTAPMVDISTQADWQPDSTPNSSSAVPTPAPMVSAFQTNAAIFRAIAWLGAQRVRASAVSVVTGINWG